MKGLFELVERTKRLSEGKVFVLTFENQNLKSLVIKLNKDQLRASQLANDTLIPFIYSDKSIELGKRPGRWTLFDTGELYDSFKVVSVTEEAIVEYADLVKEDIDFEETFDRYGSVIGLNTESRTILIEEALPIMREALLNSMLSN
jgi:hypothetical protein